MTAKPKQTRTSEPTATTTVVPDPTTYDLADCLRLLGLHTLKEQLRRAGTLQRARGIFGEALASARRRLELAHKAEYPFHQVTIERTLGMRDLLTRFRRASVVWDGSLGHADLEVEDEHGQRVRLYEDEALAAVDGGAG